MKKNKMTKAKKEFIRRCIAFGREWERYRCKPRGWSEQTLLQELETLLGDQLDGALREIIKWFSELNLKTEQKINKDVSILLKRIQNRGK